MSIFVTSIYLLFMLYMSFLKASVWSSRESAINMEFARNSESPRLLSDYSQLQFERGNFAESFNALNKIIDEVSLARVSGNHSIALL